MIVIPDRGTLQLCRAESATVSGIANVLIKVPGTPGTEAARLIDGGMGWFASPHAGDYFKVYITDEDNILGYGAGTVLGSYTDDDMDSANQGWYFPPTGYMEIHALGGMGRLVAGLYLKIIGTKGDLSSDTLRVNIKWGKPE